MKKLSKLFIAVVMVFAVIAVPATSNASVLAGLGLSKAVAGSYVVEGEIYVAAAIAAATLCAVVWHVPAWSAAKDNHSEAAYQAAEMWPQQVFDQFPGGTPGRKNSQAVVASSVALNSDTNSTSGYWESKVLASNK